MKINFVYDLSKAGNFMFLAKEEEEKESLGYFPINVSWAKSQNSLKRFFLFLFGSIFFRFTVFFLLAKEIFLFFIF